MNTSLASIILLPILFALICSQKVGDTACISAGLNLRSSPCGNVVKLSTGSESGKVLDARWQSCSFGGFTWLLVAVPGLGNVWAAKETDLVHTCNPGSGSKDFNVPQVHQIFDTPDEFAGHWACGPTTAVMIAAYYKKLTPRPITVSSPYRHTNDFGWYVSNVYTSPTGFVFNRGQNDARGRIAYGAYGTCTEGGLAWAWRMYEYFKHHNLNYKFYDVATPAIVKSSLDKGHLVALSTNINGGHIFVVRGYVDGGARFIVNDPNGDGNLPSYGREMNGKGVKYTWAFMKTLWMIEVWA